jgi:hypothetical protein
MTFFQKLSQYSETNKMGPSNIALVIGPNLLWSLAEQDSSTGMSDPTVRSKVIELIIEHLNWFFPEGASYSLSPVPLTQSKPTPRVHSESGQTSSGQPFPLPRAKPRPGSGSGIRKPLPLPP